MRIRLIALIAAAGLIAAACSSSPEVEAAAESTTTTTTTAPATTTTEAGVVLPDYAAQADSLAQAENDSDLPPNDPESAIGSYGYSRYVYTQSGDDVVPVLVEGPLGYQVRCQEAAKDCSYHELKALYESGAEVPSYLGMDRDTLGELVDQLDRVNVAVMQYEDIGAACAAGFTKSTNQVANMGIHMIDEGARGFNPDRPQMVLFAKEGGLGLGRDQIGDCVGGTWTGESGYSPVGAVFNLNLEDDHPEGFAGPIDNWHIHYNTCIGRTSNAGQEDPNASAEGTQSSTTAEVCRAQGGFFLPVISSWMMHAYVADDFDTQSGVFSMFNPTVWPLSDPDRLQSERQVDHEHVVDAPIINFSFGEIKVAVGETVRFSNSDSVPHTVTAGSFFEPSDDFDSGIISTGQAFDLTFDEPGEYALFCVLHPDMTATVVVG